MAVISILNQKGGVGKTTLSINLARAFALAGTNSLLIDSDPQRSTREWHSRADGNLLNVIGLDVPTIDKDVRKIDLQYDYIFIDGAPRLSKMAAKTIICSDIVLIPVTPSSYDIWASEDIIDLVQQRIEITNNKLKSAFIVSNQKTNTLSSKDVRETLSVYNLPIFNSGTFNRQAYSDCASIGKTIFEISKRQGAREAQQEILDIKSELLEYIK